MKIWVHPYQLVPRVPHVAPRLGALLKVEWAVGQTGYSDLHPYPEYGEPALDEHIAKLATVDFTPLVEIAMEFNYIDREYRLLKRNAFLGLILPRAHRLVTDITTLDPRQLTEYQAAGFTHLKVKLGRHLETETAALNKLACASALNWRLDFNGRLSEAEFTSWWRDLDEAVRARIDFVEDPARGELGKAGPWADDWSKQKFAKTKVIKPARESTESLAAYDRVIFTHSLDHPFGQACAAWTAANHYQRHPKQTEVCGIAANEVYQQDDFSRAWSCFGPRMKPTTGTGFGFDEQLAALAWERLL